jgi:hypothetical protein
MEQTNQFMTLHVASRTVSIPGKSPSANLLPAQSGCSEPVAIDRARILIGSYRRGEAEDKEIYVGAIAAILACYPESVARFVTDPRTGLSGAIDWLPSVAQVKAACERAMQPLRAEQQRLLERERTRAVLASKVTVSPERRKALATDLRQKLADHANALAKEYAQRPPMPSERLIASWTQQAEAQIPPG